MKKVFVDDIAVTGNLSPGPGSHEAKAHIQYEPKKGLAFTMRRRVDPFEIQLKRSKKLPGPSSYQHNELTGSQIPMSDKKTQ